nr:hypothetical protein CFP56_55826 [Quercus suber]
MKWAYGWSSMVLWNEMGRFSKDLEVLEDQQRVVDLESWFRELEVREMLANSIGVNHGRISLKHCRKGPVGLLVSSCC